MGRATLYAQDVKAKMEISIHALRGEGDVPKSERVPLADISIHALRGEGDAVLEQNCRLWRISIHALRGEGD